MNTNPILSIMLSAGLVLASGLTVQANQSGPFLESTSTRATSVRSTMQNKHFLQLAQNNSCNSSCVDGAISRCQNVMGGSGQNWWNVGGNMYNCVAQSLPAQCGMVISAWRTENAGQGGWVQVDTRPDAAGTNLNCINTFRIN